MDERRRKPLDERLLPAEKPGARRVQYELDVSLYGCPLLIEVPADKPEMEQEYLARLAKRTLTSMLERPNG